MTRGWLVLLGALLASAACSLGFLAPEQVGAGIGRLSVVNASALLALISADEACGFAAADVRDAAVLDGEVGAVGTRTLAIEGCALDFPDGVVVSTNCEGERLRASGRATVSGTLSVVGLLTGNPDNPVAPSDPDASRFQLSATLEDFHVELDGSDNALTVGEGTMLIDARPRLAALYDYPGICGWASPNIAFDHVGLTGAQVTVASEDLAPFNAEVTTMSVIAQLGVGADGDANTFEGAIEVDGRRVVIPEEGDEGLDPDFDEAEWVASYAACVDEDGPTRPLVPVTFECPGIDRLLAVGAGQRVVEDMLLLSRVIQADTRCGLGSPAAEESVVLVGDAIGEAATRERAVSGCELVYDEPTPLRLGCSDDAIVVEGRVIVDATEILSGVRVDDVQRPLLPADDGLTIGLTARLDDFTVRHPGRDFFLRYRSGTVTSDVQRRLALADNGYCEVITDIARITVTIDAADAQLVTEELTANVALGSTAVEAVNGRWGDETNVLRGDIDVNGTTYPLGAGVDGSLVSLYDQAAFDEGWQCAPSLAQPISFACPTP